VVTLESGAKQSESQNAAPTSVATTS
jgi:hypothetical protein